MHPREIRIEDYNYDLPDERIAKHPLQERDASKLLIYKDRVVEDDIYNKIAVHIPAGSLLVFNQTKVVHARLLFKKPTGGIIEIFCLEPAGVYADVPTAMLQKGEVLWQCLVGGAAKWKHGMELTLTNETPGFVLRARVDEKQAGSYIIALRWDNTDLTFAEVLHHAGKVPLPPYLHREANKDDDARYQTIFAKNEGSVAAPTAALHFTENVMKSLQQKGIDTAFVTLHVGAGTFKPVKSETLEGHEMHAEWIEVNTDTIMQLIAGLDKGIIAVGTTSMRTLESLYWIGNKLLQKLPVDFKEIAVEQWDPYEVADSCTAALALRAVATYMQEQHLDRLITRTRILIAPGYEVKIVKGLITNFHQPQSTLLLLVGALIGEGRKQVYDHALQHDYRFLSYGDGCLLWR